MKYEYIKGLQIYGFHNLKDSSDHILNFKGLLDCKKSIYF